MFKKLNFLKYYGTKISIFQWEIRIFDPKFSYLIFEVVIFWGFWGPATSRGDKRNKTKVFPSILMKFWSRNNLNQLDWLTPQDIYCVVCYIRKEAPLHDSKTISSHYKENSHTWFVAVDYNICWKKHPLFESIVSHYIPKWD